MPLLFEWEGNKAALNFKKHKVSFEEAKTVFQDPLGAVFFDESHSFEEDREIIVGYSRQNRLLFVGFTERRPDVVRIISARKATKPERTAHEENQSK